MEGREKKVYYYLFCGSLHAFLFVFLEVEMKSKMNTYEKKIRTYLKDMGIRNDLAGYQYLCDIIMCNLITPNRILRRAIEEEAKKYLENK